MRPCVRDLLADNYRLTNENERLRTELAEAVTALPQAVRNERERCAQQCERRADSLPFGGADAARLCARDIRNGAD